MRAVASHLNPAFSRNSTLHGGVRLLLLASALLLWVVHTARPLPFSGAASSTTYDGNIASDGLHNVEYDDADRLTAVRGAWRVAYVYDALWRRRIKWEKSWNRSGWTWTNVTTYVYDRHTPAPASAMGRITTSCSPHTRGWT